MAEPRMWGVDAEFVAEYVEAFYKDNGHGPTRQDFAEVIGWSQTRNLPGVRAAFAEGLIRYDDASRFVPCAVYNQDDAPASRRDG